MKPQMKAPMKAPPIPKGKKALTKLDAVIDDAMKANGYPDKDK